MSIRDLGGRLEAQGLAFGIVLSRFNSRVTDLLLAGALDGLRRHGATDDGIVVARVPGSFEIPQGVRWLAGGLGPEGKGARASAAVKPDAILALGALVRGETPHFDHLAAVVTRALDTIAGETGVPVANGVLTCDTLEQAMERAGGKGGNKGFEAAMTAIEMAHLRRLIAGR
jgi:6,7-dimethyl-8-ribityllumazine synthase